MSQPSLLIVDDEVGVRESLKIVFSKDYRRESLKIVFSKDYRLLEADSVEVAIQKVQEERPEIVFLDILMPGARPSCGSKSLIPIVKS